MEQGKKILLVEDEDFIRDIYNRQLTKAGFIVKTAADGNSGLDALKTDTFDILLLDIMLPGINGLQMLKQFREINPNSTIKVVLLTNLGQEAVIKEGFELGATAYLIKASYTPDQIVNEVKTILSGGQAQNSNPNPTPVQSVPTQPTAQPEPSVQPTIQPATPPVSQSLAQSTDQTVIPTPQPLPENK